MKPKVGDIVLIDKGNPAGHRTGLVINVYVNDEHDICDVYCLFDVLSFEGKMITNVDEWRVNPVYF